MRAHTHAVAFSPCSGLGGNEHFEECSCTAVTNEVHILFHCQDLIVCSLRKKHSLLFLSFLPVIFCECHHCKEHYKKGLMGWTGNDHY